MSEFVFGFAIVAGALMLLMGADVALGGPRRRAVEITRRRADRAPASAPVAPYRDDLSAALAQCAALKRQLKDRKSEWTWSPWTSIVVKNVVKAPEQGNGDGEVPQ